MYRSKKRVSIISRESNDKTLDVSMLEAELKRRGAEVTVLSRLLTKEKSVKALGYIGHVIRQEAAILASDVVVLDTYCIPVSMLPRRRGTKVVQIWHALGAIKKFGWQTVGKEGGSSEKIAKLMRMHRGYDYVTAASDITANHFCEAFKVSAGKIVKHGLPRTDYIRSVSGGSRREYMRKRILSEYPQLRRSEQSKVSMTADLKETGSMNEEGVLKCSGPTGRQTILYAPTFRSGKAVDVGSLAAALNPEKFDLVVKLHPVYSKGLGGNAASDGRRQAATVIKPENQGTSIRGIGMAEGRTTPKRAKGVSPILDDKFSSYDWLAVADIVISDYSSFVIESSLADKPLYIYAYDLDEYTGSTGLNMDFAKEPLAPYVFTDARRLAEQIESDNEEKEGGYDKDALAAFRARYIDLKSSEPDAGENSCTEELAEFILSLAE